jgi:hypothetical protein
MRHNKLLITMAILCFMLLIFGCSGKSEDKKTQENKNQDSQVQSPSAPAGNAELAKAYTFKKDFMEGLFRIQGVRNIDFFKSRVDFAETGLTDANRLLNETQNTQAREFLAKLTDLMRQYADSGRKLISSSEEIEKIDKDIKDLRDNPQSIADSSLRYAREKQLGEQRSFLSGNHGLAVGALQKAERELNELK